MILRVKAWLQNAKKKDIQEGSTGIVALVSHGFTAPIEAKTPTGCAALWPKPKETCHGFLWVFLVEVDIGKGQTKVVMRMLFACQNFLVRQIWFALFKCKCVVDTCNG